MVTSHWRRINGVNSSKHSFNDSRAYKNYQSVGMGVSVLQSNEGFGNAQIHERTIPLTANTLMNLQSVSKTILAISIMQLVEKGQILLDDPVVKYLPYFQTKNKEISDRITIKHLLTHTGGLPQAIGITQWEYFTAGYTLLADVLEKVTKMKWEEYIKKYIFEPLEMNHTTAYMKEYRS
ncbi:serine hydrolase domain-containing protein [Aneurinibacillus migulanus]|uniref:Beta-lactamase n=1 Tax=Aneurinibacillus migulanus TaxID=47500 RepID=A0A1G8Q4G7_ANEMI|nr:serine hydrolase domain-containing protein [Aneurinibacillus migulanus]MED0893921.1 serine hydrolase [Aneurinibacillus migulanus]MED1616686.1 serine hydrolase [Aneurinibacillus migulanus]GED13527.1 hypothetical protein AMI01nite_15180 [Aneurinibacillus migulanus]SDI99345.1 Beta-lactamase [Aneurinibacillus migulanus]